MFDTIPDDMPIHFTSYGPSHLCVSIDTTLVPDALLPCPTENYIHVGQAIGVPLRWPVDLVLPYTKVCINFTYVFGYVRVIDLITL